MVLRLGVDTGGTFTDLALADGDRGVIAVLKVPSTRHDPGEAILDGIRRLIGDHGADPATIGFLGHGTTVATNAVLENTAARVGMLTTRGFRDVLELARQRRPALYDLDVPKPDPVVPRDLRLEIPERLGPDGSVVTPLDLAQARKSLEALTGAGAEAIAVCLLHSYASPGHEERLRELAAELAPGIPVSLSSDVLREFREYGRFTTTVLNAALIPVMASYLRRLSDAVTATGITSGLHVIASNGGVMSAHTAADHPVGTLFSGPSAGVLGAVRVASAAGHGDIITFDMGGTSTDVCLIRDGVIPVVHEREMAGKPVLGAMADIHSVGAGGGSIAWVDDGGLLKTGPRSAGARPGPAAYGHGGTEPTVTDANVVLGYLHPDAPLAGTLRVDTEAARAAIHAKVGGPLRLSTEQAADGILRVLQASLVRAVRAISVERGTDPRDFTLMAFGGAGGLHAARLARELGIRRVLVPPSPGILCAFGALAADLRADFSATCLTSADAAGLPALRDALAVLADRARDWLDGEGVPPGTARREATVELRYAGQNYQLPAGIGLDPDTGALAAAVAAFHRGHEERYGYAAPAEPVQAVTVRLTVTAPTAEIGTVTLPPAAGPAEPAALRKVYFAEAGAAIDCPVYERAAFGAGTTLAGPAIVGQLDSTTVVLPGQRARVDAAGNLLIEEESA
ncbi:MAG TPA: hydantoinase/oxoprolinase family protein [Trebonia sp.]|jgi:N-methylhydantoinase A